MDALTAATIVDQGHDGHEDIDQGHSAPDVDNLDKRKSVIKDTDCLGSGPSFLTKRKSQLPMAYFLVQSLAFLSASASFAFHNSATSFANGSSGLGAERRAY